jgi:hypothetical protein
MKFVEISGEVLLKMAEPDEIDGLHKAGVTDKCQVRINPQGDIELLRHGHWNIIGGLIGDYRARIKRVTGKDWS